LIKKQLNNQKGGPHLALSKGEGSKKARSGEKVDGRSLVGMSRHRQCFTLTLLAELTHPIYATLDHPLSRKRQRGLGKIIPLKIYR
jgi:hypothetical protein